MGGQSKNLKVLLTKARRMSSEEVMLANCTMGAFLALRIIPFISLRHWQMPFPFLLAQNMKAPSSLGATAVNQNQPLATTTRTATTDDAATTAVPSLSDFIQDRYSQPSQHVVIGNKAGDSDSIISAITLAYVESLISLIAMRRKGKSSESSATHEEQDVSWKMASLRTPIVSIPKIDLVSQRPETTLLLKLAGISESVQDKLIFVDDPRLQTTRSTSSSGASSNGSMKGANVTLVDHNRLDTDFEPLKWKVRAIRDHHLDEGYHSDTCLFHQVAFDNKKGHALVASTCSLIVERMQENDCCAVFTGHNSKYPADLSLLLLGVILLDSVNLNPAAGKVTPRDVAAVEHLLNNTSWQDLSVATQDRLGMIVKQDSTNNETNKPNKILLFNALQSAKFDPNFWRGLSIRDALRLDYKRFEASLPSTAIQAFGMSSVLLSLQDFVQGHGDDGQQRIHDFMQEKEIDFFAIMFASSSTLNLLERQMMICSRDSSLVSNVVAYLEQNDSLELSEIDDYVASSITDVPVTSRCFDQQNAKASRKQVAPILLEFFRNNTSLASL